MISRTAWLCMLSPARRRRRRELLHFYFLRDIVNLRDVECPECHFVIPMPARQSCTVCGWCGVALDSVEVPR